MNKDNNYSPLNIVSDKHLSISDLPEEYDKSTVLPTIGKIVNIVFKITVALALIMFICYLIISFYTVETQIVTIGTNINNNINFVHDIIIEHNKTVVDLEIKLDKLIIDINHYLNQLNKTIHLK